MWELGFNWPNILFVFVVARLNKFLLCVFAVWNWDF